MEDYWDEIFAIESIFNDLADLSKIQYFFNEAADMHSTILELAQSLGMLEYYIFRLRQDCYDRKHSPQLRYAETVLRRYEEFFRKAKHLPRLCYKYYRAY